MKLRKIRNVDLSVCSGEQKIAYNIAFDYGYINFGGKLTAKECFELYEKTHPADGRFNHEAIRTALLNGFDNWISGKYHILTTYKEIGKAFPLA